MPSYKARELQPMIIGRQACPVKPLTRLTDVCFNQDIRLMAVEFSMFAHTVLCRPQQPFLIHKCIAEISTGRETTIFRYRPGSPWPVK